MFNTIYKLAAYLLEKKEIYRSFFYRHRNLLDEKCKNIPIGIEGHQDQVIEYFEILELAAPFEIIELPENCAQFLKWNKHLILIEDPKFFHSSLSHLKLWKEFSNTSLKFFLQSSDGSNWYEKRKRLKRQAHFELDTPFKRTKKTALENIKQIRNVLRQNPLLRYQDLQELEMKNAQAVIESFPALQIYRAEFLEKLKHSLPLS